MRTIEQIQAQMRRRAVYKLIAIGVALLGLACASIYGAVEGGSWVWHRLAGPAQVQVQAPPPAPAPPPPPPAAPVQVATGGPCRDVRGHFARCLPGQTSELRSECHHARRTRYVIVE
jgi:hypothetical protein